MKISIIYLTLFLCISTILFSCNKENNSKSLEEFYHLKVNNNLIKIVACGTSEYVAQYLGDSAIFAAFGCGGERAGFYLQGQILDGTYILDNKNSAWYGLGIKSYQTDSLNKGILTIRSRIFELANGGHIPIVEGEFSFDAVDKNTGLKIKVTSGTYLLRKYQF
jgi:hypothetical protein